MFIQNFNVEADALFGGERVHVAANGIHLTRNLFRGTRLSAFEQHVFNEMRDAVRFGGFVPRPGLDPDSEGNRTNVTHFLGKDRQTVR